MDRDKDPIFLSYIEDLIQSTARGIEAAEERGNNSFMLALNTSIIDSDGKLKELIDIIHLRFIRDIKSIEHVRTYSNDGVDIPVLEVKLRKEKLL